MSKKIAIVAGEPSGDLLASRIIKGMQDHQANLSFNGIGGHLANDNEVHLRDSSFENGTIFP